MDVKKASWIKKITVTDRIAFMLILFGIVGFICLPYLITQTSYLNFKKISFGKPNEIGDMIGGIVGPFIGLISASLVYLTIREQINANKTIQQQFEKEETTRFEKVIFEEIAKEIYIIIEEIEVIQGLSLKNKNLEKKEIISIVAVSAIFDNGNLNFQFDDYTEILHFKKLFKKLIDYLDLLTENIKNEKAFYKIVEIKMGKIYFCFENSLNKVKKFNDVNNKYEVSNFAKLEYLEMFLLLVRYINLEIKIKLFNQPTEKRNQDLIEYEVFFKMAKFLEAYKIKIVKFEEVGSQISSHRFNKSQYAYYGEQLKNYHMQGNVIFEEFRTLESNLEKFLEDFYGRNIIVKNTFEDYHKNLIQKISGKYLYFPILKNKLN